MWPSRATDLETTAPGGRNDALNHTGWTLGRCIAVGALDQRDLEDRVWASQARRRWTAIRPSARWSST